MASVLKLHLLPLGVPKWPGQYTQNAVAAFFGPPHVAALPHPIAPAIGFAAMDCGYGNVLALPALGFAGMNLVGVADWVQLAKYLESKRNLLISAFDAAISPAGPCVTTFPFMAQLEKSEKSSVGYFLGMIYARYALEKALSLQAGALQVNRILHFHTGATAPITISGIAPPFANAANPDFLIELSDGSWGLLEAKGTLGVRRASQLKTAAGQVSKYAQVNFSVGPAAPVVIPVKFTAISYAYVRNGDLQVEYLDPEEDDDPIERVRLGKAEAVPVFMPAADCLRFLQACGHFASQADDGGEAGRYMHWARFKDGLWLGVPNDMWNSFEKLADLMTLFQAVFGKGCVNSCAPLIGANSIDFEVTFTRMASTRLQRLADDEAFIFNQDASRLLARVDTSRHSNEAIRLGEFAKDVANPASANAIIQNLNGLLNSLRRLSELKLGDERERYIKLLSNGLCIADDAGRKYLDADPPSNTERF
ncbi:hypothetical protein WAB97_008390 [Stenotrophomonas maltophilia]|uniref:hypothetical protein n=1 Tax=Stenotrophomonas maltophilia TaxID=40324 RepID=UPI0033280C22